MVTVYKEVTVTYSVAVDPEQTVYGYWGMDYPPLDHQLLLKDVKVTEYVHGKHTNTPIGTCVYSGSREKVHSKLKELEITN